MTEQNIYFHNIKPSNSEHENFIRARKDSKIDKVLLLNQIWEDKSNYFKFVDFAQKILDNKFERPRNAIELSRNDQVTFNAKNTPKFLKTMDIDTWFKKLPHPILIDSTMVFGGVGLSMGLPIIDLGGSDAQRKEYIPKLQSGEIICAYGQTELGHGSDVQSLETTAVYNEVDEIFTINTPSISSYKWWPGDLGLFSNFVIIYARVYSLGKYRGMYPLFFQVRDMITHKMFPGVEGGDIGPKLGFGPLSNGFMAFRSFKVPRTSLLSKYVEVYKDGSFEIKGDIRAYYSAMMAIRQGITVALPTEMLKTVLIALRYSHIRKQFRPQEILLERPIIDYQLQKSKIYPYLAVSYVFCLSSMKIRHIISQHNELVNKSQNFKLMKEVHILLSFGKALYSGYGLNCMFAMMQACGGHGFLDGSGVSKTIDVYFPATIYEGINQVLLVQVGNELMKSYLLVLKNPAKVRLLDQMSYFKNMDKIFEIKAQSKNCRDIVTYMNIFAKTTLSLCRKANQIKKNLSSKMSDKDFYDKKAGTLMTDATLSHGFYISLEFFNEKVSTLLESPLKNALSKLGLLAAVFFMDQIPSTIFTCDAVESDFFEKTRQMHEELLDEIHPDALVLAEGFGFPEFYISRNSTLANSNGQVYENLMGYAKHYGELNKIDVHPTMLEYISATKKGELMNAKL